MAPSWHQRPEKWEKQLPLAGEAVFTRKTFELKDLGHVMLRVTAFAKQGYRIYLKANLIAEDRSRSEIRAPRRYCLNDKAKERFKTGRNAIAATSFLECFRGKAGNIEVSVEGLWEFPRAD